MRFAKTSSNITRYQMAGARSRCAHSTSHSLINRPHHRLRPRRRRSRSRLKGDLIEMKGNAKVLSALVNGAGLEACLMLQYQLDARLLKRIGLKKNASNASEMAEDAEGFLKRVTDRIILLGGDPSYQVAAIADRGTVTALL